MTDIVERLKNADFTMCREISDEDQWNLMREAADEIERLRAALNEIASHALSRDYPFDDVDPYDGLHNNSVRDFALRALKEPPPNGE